MPTLSQEAVVWTLNNFSVVSQVVLTDMEGSISNGQDGKREITNNSTLLLDLSQKAFKMLDVFEALPMDIQMEGLDILQNVVNSVMHKITKGRFVQIFNLFDIASDYFLYL